VDADGQHEPKEIPKLLHALGVEKVDMAIRNLNPSEPFQDIAI
jgi:hypothetical protein